MQNILFLLSCYPGLGGIEKVTNYIANNLVGVFKITIASFMHIENQKMVDNLNSGISYIKFPNDKVPLSQDNIDYLNLLLKENQFDYLIFQDSYSPFYRILGYIKPETRKSFRLIIVEHNTPKCLYKDLLYSYQLFPTTIKEILRLVKAPYSLLKVYQDIKKSHIWLYDICDTYVILSHLFLKDFEDLNNGRSEKVVVIPNPLTIPIVNHVNAKKNQVLFIGSLNKRKGIDYLIEIWSQIETAASGWELVILGTGEMEPYIRNYISSHALRHVQLLGYQSDVVPYLQQSRCLLMTSRYEGFGLVLTEAMAYGCVPIAFDSFSSVHDIITPDCGIIIPKFNCSVYSTQVMELMNNTAKWEQMSIHSIKRSREQFSVQSIIARWLDILK